MPCIPCSDSKLAGFYAICVVVSSGVEESDEVLTVIMGVCRALQMATILFYLSDVEDGGDTIFPLEGRYGQEQLKGTGFNYKSCEGGYRVCTRPRLPR